ncbi:hypothetical protein GVN20_25955 [Runella sp. CRIBMP]|uniref:hypothetical protein n=1 Tax=Runella sp. CRIBMP TaxID=2683261 RepID=UPI001412502C|nr:hypothetical protein [Runella sp. CRIBMP]NBB22827.1 hypothetical protein [Runella sp. CRIBMP]
MKNALFVLFLALSLAGRSQSSATSEVKGQGTPVSPQGILYRPGVVVMLHGGTAGLGAGVAVALHRRVNLRVGVNAFTYQTQILSGKDTDDLQIAFDVKAKLKSANVLLDLYPFKNLGLHLTGGLYYNLNEMTFFGKPTKDVKFNDVVFNIDEIGTLDGKASFNKTAPYVGFGWGQPFLRNRFKVSFDAGFFFMQSPKITFRTTKMLEPSSDQGAVIEQSLEPVKYYPVVNISLSYNLGKFW